MGMQSYVRVSVDCGTCKASGNSKEVLFGGSGFVNNLLMGRPFPMQAMEARAQHLDEALLSNAFAWMRKATDDGQDGGQPLQSLRVVDQTILLGCQEYKETRNKLDSRQAGSIGLYGGTLTDQEAQMRAAHDESM
jgi:hypothetical protein